MVQLEFIAMLESATSWMSTDVDIYDTACQGIFYLVLSMMSESVYQIYVHITHTRL